MLLPSIGTSSYCTCIIDLVRIYECRAGRKGSAAAKGAGDDASSDNAANALVLSGPEKKHHKVRSSKRRNGGLCVGIGHSAQLLHHTILARVCLQVYVVELTRKPLFPGIYTPVMVSKNEVLIKEIMETKRQG